MKFRAVLATLAALASMVKAQQQPPTCDAQPAGTDTSVELSISHIDSMANELKDNFINRDACWQLVTKRIFGALQFSKLLITEGGQIYDFQQLHDSDDTEMAKFADHIKQTFKESFIDCDNASCVVEKWCPLIFDGSTFYSISSELNDQIVNNCLYEGWRFSDMIGNLSLGSVCEFDIVPAQFSDCSSNNS